MFAARVLAGLAARHTGLIQAMIADQVNPDEAARYMGLFGAAIGTGFVTGLGLDRSFSLFGEGPLHQAPGLLADGFGTIASLV